MKGSQKILLFGVFLFFLAMGSSFVYSSESSKSNSLRYLEDEDIELRELEDSKDQKFDCSSVENSTKCNFEHMDCNDLKTECSCKAEYANDPKGSKYCDVERKKQLTAFLLELFVGFGAGHFYRHDYLMASLKLVAFVFGIYVICLFPLTAKCVTDCCDSDCLVVLVSIIFYLYALGLAFWYIWDLVYFGKNKYPDRSHEGLEIDLQHW